MFKDCAKIFVFISCLIIIIIAVVRHIRSVNYEQNGDYYYRCLGGVRYLYSGEYGKSEVLMKDVNDKPVACK
jgi:hypothetical protein